MLNRARSIAAEHARLSEQLADSFDTKTAKRVGELAPVTNALKEWDKANEVCSPSTSSIYYSIQCKDTHSLRFSPI